MNLKAKKWALALLTVSMLFGSMTFVSNQNSVTIAGKHDISPDAPKKPQYFAAKHDITPDSPRKPGYFATKDTISPDSPSKFTHFL